MGLVTAIFLCSELVSISVKFLACDRMSLFAFFEASVKYIIMLDKYRRKVLDSKKRFSMSSMKSKKIIMRDVLKPRNLDIKRLVRAYKNDPKTSSYICLFKEQSKNLIG